MTDTHNIKRHPIRGFLYGIVFGLGLAMVAVGQGWAALGTWPPFILFAVGVVIGTLWSMFGPAKGPKGAEPAPEPDPTPEPIEDHNLEGNTGETPAAEPGFAGDPVEEPSEPH